MDIIEWSVNATYHDWRDHKFFKEFVHSVMKLGLLGNIEWVEPTMSSDRKTISINISNDFPDKLIDEHFLDEEIPCYTFGGNTPTPWQIVYSVYGYVKDPENLRAVNWLKFSFDRNLVSTKEKSNALMKSFCELHRAENTEYAKIHPYDHWHKLDDGLYSTSVTNLLRGVFWANYLGLGHIGLFDKHKLNSLDAWKIVKHTNAELCFIAAPEINNADSETSEKEMLRLTKFFKAALI